MSSVLFQDLSYFLQALAEELAYHMGYAIELVDKIVEWRPESADWSSKAYPISENLKY